jgi:hypothetical protein
LRRARRQAAKCGLAITASFGGYSVITALTDRPRSVHGSAGVGLNEIEQELPATPNKGPRPLDDATIDKLIERAGPDRVRERLCVRGHRRIAAE